MFNIIPSELLFAILFIVVLIATWPDPLWNLLQYGGIALLAFDQLFRAATSEELS